jgi:hypothetical protein
MIRLTCAQGEVAACGMSAMPPPSCGWLTAYVSFSRDDADLV